MKDRLDTLAAWLALALLWSACPAGAPPASRPRLESCRVAVAQGTVRFTIPYVHTRPLGEGLLIVASIRSSRGEELLRLHVHRGDRAILPGGSGEELLANEGYVDTASARGGTLEFAFPERAPGVYDLSGVQGRAHVVVQWEKGEGAVPVGEVDAEKLVF